METGGVKASSPEPGGPAVRDVRRSYVEEQYPTLVNNNRLTKTDLGRLRQEASAFDHKPLLSVLMPVFGPDGWWLERALDSVVGQVYPRWELRVCVNGHTDGRTRDLLSRYEWLDERVKVSYRPEQEATAAGLYNAALSSAEGEFVCLLGEEDELAPDALFEVVKLLQDRPEEAGLIYTDEDAVDEKGRRSAPRFKPGWSPELLLSADYVSRLSVYRKSLLEEIGGFREGFSGAALDYDLVLRTTEKTETILHVPKVLYHRRKAEASSAPGDESRAAEGARRALSEALERRNLEGVVEDGLLPGTFRAKLKVQGEPLVSIIMPTKDHAWLLESCVGSIERLTTYPNYEILIVDNGSTEPETLEYLASTPHRVIPFPEKYNHPKINNLAISQARGEYVLLLNDDTEVIGGGWLEAMLEHAQRPEVGAVGARLLYPDGRVQHAGVVVGVGHTWMRGVATHAYRFFHPSSRGHLGTLMSTCNYSAVTAACVLMRKEVYEEVGGLDEENLPVSFDDVDLCLKIRERGYRVVYTPYAELYHYETVTRKKSDDPAEVLYMRERWGEVLDSDPHYNPNFSRGSGDFNLRADLLRPRVLRPKPGQEDPTTEFKNQTLMSPEQFDEYLRRQHVAARDSVRFSLAPRESAGITLSAQLEILERAISEGERALAPREQTGRPGPREGVGAEQLIWLFGSPRTGSTWLSKMMADLDGQERWNEPYVGLLFGSFLYERLGGASRLLSNPNFILAERYRGVWLGSIREFVLAGAAARFPDLGDDEHLVIKEPNGSVGAGLLMEALPESRMVFLIRDPRDVVASRLDAVGERGWTGQDRDLSGRERLEEFTRHLAEDYLLSVEQVRKAYEKHQGGKAFVRYEDLRRDPLGSLKTMYADLQVEYDKAQLAAAVARQSWEQIPQADKGTGKFYRKAEPGSWRDDLSSEQIRIIEETTGSILSKYY